MDGKMTVEVAGPSEGYAEEVVDVTQEINLEEFLELTVEEILLC